jgi:CheY-like chemotaxis protein
MLATRRVPVMDGREFMDRVRETPELRACTILVVRADKIAPPMGAAGYLRKLFEVEELLAALERYCPHE